MTEKRTQCCSGFGRLGPDGACGGRQDMCPESLMGAEDPAKCQVGNFDGHSTSLCTVHFPLCRAKREVKYCSEKEICRAVTCVERNPRKGTDWTSFYQGCYDNSSVLLQSELEIAGKIAGSNFCMNTIASRSVLAQMQSQTCRKGGNYYFKVLARP